MLALTAFGQVGPVAFVLAVAAMLGGIAVFGSTQSTRDQVTSTIEVREAERAALINSLELREVGSE
jgi:hypothetical protein